MPPSLNPDQKMLILGLAYLDGDRRRLDGRQFLELVGQHDGRDLAHGLLEEALTNSSSDDMEFAVILLFEFGVRREDLPLLIQAAPGDWHRSHDDVVTLLQDLAAPEAIPVLINLARHQPVSLDEIDAQTLANNATWAIYTIGGSSADETLQRLSTQEGSSTQALSAQLLERLRSARESMGDQ